MLAEMTFDIDSRIKYLKGNPGDKEGIVGINFDHKGRRIRAQVRFGISKSEVDAINELRILLEQIDKS